MATKQRKSLQDLAEVFEETPAVNVSKMSKQMETAKLKKQAQKELAAERKAQFSAPVAKAKKVRTPKPVDPVIERMYATTLEEVAKVVRPHMPVVLPAELADVESIPEFAALIEAAKMRESAFDADQVYQAKLETKRDLEKQQRKFSSRYMELFSEHMQAWLDEPGHEYRKRLNPKEPHVKKLRLWVSGLINKAITAQDETAAEYIKLEEQLEDVRKWLSIHIADKDENEFKSKQALSKIGAKYEDVFAL